MARSFNDSNPDYISVADNAVLDYGDFTISMWLNIVDFFYTLGYFYSHGTVNTSDSLNIFANDDLKKIDIYVGRGGANGATYNRASWSYTNEVWFNYVVTFDQTAGTVIQYKDGVSGGSTTNTPNTTTAISGPLILGGREDFSFSRFLEGRMAEVAKWNRVLTSGEINSLAKKYAPNNIQNGLQFYMPLNRQLIETKVPLTLTNNGSAVYNHPPIINHI